MPILRPKLRRFDFLALKDKAPGNDAAQVPAAATISFYRSGAASRTTATITPSDPDPAVVTVEDTGTIQIGEQLAVGASTQARFLVTSIPDATHLELTAILSTNLVDGDRFIRLAAPLTVYKDSYGAIAAGTSLTCDASTGRAFAYVTEPRFDYVIAGAGVTPRVIPDAEGGLIRSPQNWFNVLDYPSIQAAIDAVPAEGGVVYIPGSVTPYSATTTPSYTPPIRLPHNRAITLRGDGPYASILKSNSTTADMIHMAGDYQTVEGLMLWGPGSTGSGRGIRVWRDGDYNVPGVAPATNIIYRTAIRDCLIFQTASWGLYVDTAVRPGGNKTNHVVIGYVERVEFNQIKSGGHIYMTPPPANAGTGGGNPPISGDHTTWLFHGCHFRQIQDYGFRAQFSRGLTLIACVFESDVDTLQPFVSLESCSHIRVMSCWFEGRASRTIQSSQGAYSTSHRFFIEAVRTLDARYPAHFSNITIDNCLLFRGTVGVEQQLNPRACYIGAGARNVVFSGNTIESNRALKDFVDADSDSDAVRLDNDVQATLLGGGFQMPTSSRPIHVREVSSLTKSALANNTWGLRLPRIISGDYGAELTKFAREGDVIYDADLHALRVCVGMSGGSPPTPIWKTVTVA